MPGRGKTEEEEIIAGKMGWGGGIQTERKDGSAGKRARRRVS